MSLRAFPEECLMASSRNVRWQSHLVDRLFDKEACDRFTLFAAFEFVWRVRLTWYKAVRPTAFVYVSQEMQSRQHASTRSFELCIISRVPSESKKKKKKKKK
eukprot:TRINITY_DN20580_c0_g2_i1.p1 TRINITY_DN20580_c0_g2~~TRINITY_DN20580_c0_g2_i1.p1  ORF type:complete len:102 (-),score=5.46 TRINITY_DN20580_c0_g2_i1:100-405(-)